MKVLIVAAAIMVVGCKKPASEPVIVKIPVPIDCPKITLPERPILPVVQEGDDVATMVKKMAIGIALLVQDNEQLRALLIPFSKPAPPVKPLDQSLPEPTKREAKL